MPFAFPPPRLTSAAVIAISALAAPAGAQTAAIAFDIAGQPLGAALIQWARQAGMEVSFPPDVVAGKHSAGLKATLPALDALGRLLANTGLTMRHGGRGVVFIVAQNAQPPVAQLDPIQAYATPPGTYVYSREQIRDTPASNQDLSSLIANHPAVRLGNSANSGANRGSMAVEEVSFHGASPYQNLYQIDGMDASNNINPANKNLSLQVGNVPSNSQAYFVDTSLLESVKVLDSFAPAEYGRFNGGVVDARLRQASGDNSLRFSYRFNSSGLTRQQVGENFSDDFADGVKGYSSTWRKHFVSAVGDYTFNDKLGMVLNVSRRESRIERVNPHRDESGNVRRQTSIQDDRVDNVLGKFTLRASADTTSDLTLKYSRRTEELVDDFFVDTSWKYNHQAYGLAWNLVHQLPGARYTLTAGYDRFQDDRRSDGNEFVTHFFVGNTGRNYTTGGFGREETLRDTWTLKNRLDFDPVSTGAVTHNIYAGLDIQHVDARFKRHQDAYGYQQRYFADGTTRQQSKTHYYAGKVNVGYDNYALYLSDQMTWRNWALTAGLRYDKETFIGNDNISPRTRLDWDVLGNGDTVLSAGWNRYYGDSILQMGLREEIKTLSELTINASGVALNNGRADPAYTKYKSLRTPYDDEWAFQLTQRMAGIEARVGFVQRNGRDQVSREGTGVQATPYIYTNNGHSQTRTWSLMLHNIEPWRAMGADWRLHASVSHERHRTNKNLAEGYDEDLDDGDLYVIYNGKRMLRADRPGVAFNRPSQASLGLTTHWPSAGVTLNNVVTWKSARDDIAYVGLGPAPERLQRYESVRVPHYWTWDASIMWQPRQIKGLELSVDVLNVLNKHPVIVPTAPNLNGNRNTYHVGREIWLQAAYQF